MSSSPSYHGVPALPLALLALMMLAACGQTGMPPAAAPSGTQSGDAGSATTSAVNGASAPDVSAATTASTTGSAATTTSPSDQPAAEVMLRRFVEAINRGDAAAVAATLAPNARFDSIGRIYQGRDEIMGRFLQPEVIALRGQYEIVNVQNEADATTFEFTFRAGSLTEHFTYRCTVRDDLLQDCVGRYVAASTAIAPAQPITTAGSSALNVPAETQCYVDAVNARRLDDLVGCFAPNGVVVDVNRRITGPDAIRAWADNEVIGGSLQVLAVDQQRPGHARLLVHWAPRGSQGWRAYYTFDYRDGRITQADLQYA